MDRRRIPLRTLMPLLIAAVLVQGVVSFAPHRHDGETVHTAVGLADHWCTHDTPEIFSVAAVHAPSSCLACVIPTPAFHQPSSSLFTVVHVSTSAEPTTPSRSSAQARRWRHQLRAPPSLA